MLLKRLSVALLALLLVGTSAGVAAADFKVAFVNVPRLLKDAPQVKKLREDIKKDFSRRDADLVAQQKQIKKLQEKLAKDGSIMSEAEASRLEKDILTRRRKLKNAQSEFQEDLALRQNEILGKLRKQIAEVIVDVAKREKMDIVLESGVVWASDRADLTDKVLAQLKK